MAKNKTRRILLYQGHKMNKLKIAQQNRTQRMKNIVESVPTYKKDQDKSGFTTLKDSSNKIEDNVKTR